MTIQHKLTGRIESVTLEQFEEMKRMGFAKNWSVLDARDKPILPPSKEIPVKILEFSSKRHPPKPHPDMLVEEDSPPIVETKKKKKKPNN